MPRVTLSYRRDDSAAIARLVFEHLRSRYGIDNVFVDIDSIEFGEDYRERIYHALRRTDYLLVLIGPKWLGPRGKGRLRIQDANDPVRIEVEHALEIGIRVVPVLLEQTPMPTPSVLPESLERLSYLNAAEVSVGRDFDGQMDRLTRFIDRTYQEVTERRTRELAEQTLPEAPPPEARSDLVPEQVVAAPAVAPLVELAAMQTSTETAGASAQKSINWYSIGWRRSFDFTGRSRRREFWWFTLVNDAIFGLLFLMLVSSGASNGQGTDYTASSFVITLITLFGIATCVPEVAVYIRRLHDTNRSGWYLLLGLIPFVGGVMLLVLCCIDSDPTPNQYGPSPKLANENRTLISA